VGSQKSLFLVIKEIVRRRINGYVVIKYVSQNQVAKGVVGVGGK
jgi:hypothetical protein